jgi:hypothetical protein
MDFIWTSIKSWWQTASMWEAVKFWVPTVMSSIALIYVIYDRRPHLVLKARKGEWFILRKSDKGVIFEGVIEVYNAGNRANAIREYRFDREEPAGGWVELESEYYAVEENSMLKGTFNVTPLMLAPYSGAEVHVQAISNLPRFPYEMKVRIEIEDIFGKRYSVDVIAKA